MTMGYSITAEQHERLCALEAEGRRCRMSTMRGAGCMTRATVAVTTESWSYRIGEGQSRVDTMPFCRRHAFRAGDEGKNFRVLSVGRIA